MADTSLQRAESLAPQPIRGVVRIVRTALVAAIIVASLLTFPSAIPWMLAFWLFWHTLLVWRGQPGWLPLVVCIAVLAVKRVDWSPALLALAGLMLVLCLVRGFRVGKSRTGWGRFTGWTGVAAIWAAWAGVTFAWYGAAHCARFPTLQPGRPVLCLGDSLTAFGYPRCLRTLLSIPVVDLGRDGIATADAIKGMASITDADPQVVVIELGGHDYLRGHSRAATKKNLETIVDACRAIGAEVILMEIPRGFMTDPFAAMERQIARERGLELISDTAIRELVLWSPFALPGMWLRPESRLSDDGLHPNARGNQALAEYVAKALTRLYGPEVLATPRPVRETKLSTGFDP